MIDYKIRIDFGTDFWQIEVENTQTIRITMSPGPLNISEVDALRIVAAIQDAMHMISLNRSTIQA